MIIIIVAFYYTDMDSREAEVDRVDRRAGQRPCWSHDLAASPFRLGAWPGSDPIEAGLAQQRGGPSWEGEARGGRRHPREDLPDHRALAGTQDHCEYWLNWFNSIQNTFKRVVNLVVPDHIISLVLNEWQMTNLCNSSTFNDNACCALRALIFAH